MWWMTYVEDRPLGGANIISVGMPSHLSGLHTGNAKFGPVDVLDIAFVASKITSIHWS